jgi:hypothetical protein
MQISPHIQLKIKLDEDNKVKVGGIYYNNTLIDDKALKAYLKEYTKNNNEEYSVQSIEDLVIGTFIDNEFKVNIELTAQSLERIINDPCK